MRRKLHYPPTTSHRVGYDESPTTVGSTYLLTNFLGNSKEYRLCIAAKDDVFGIAISTNYEKGNFIYGYFSAKAADFSMYGKESVMVNGCFKKARRKVSNKAYNLSVKSLEKCILKPIDCDEWDKSFD
jgi:hypothetical protein